MGLKILNILFFSGRKNDKKCLLRMLIDGMTSKSKITVSKFNNVGKEAIHVPIRIESYFLESVVIVESV